MCCNQSNPSEFNGLIGWYYDRVSRGFREAYHHPTYRTKSILILRRRSRLTKWTVQRDILYRKLDS